MTNVKRGFASDNNSGVSQEVLDMLAQVNVGHAVGYGDDDVTRALQAKIKDLFGEQALIYPVFTGTAANVLGISSVLSRFHSVICAESSHINVDECGAPERFGGNKLVPIQTNNGKLSTESIQPKLVGFGFEHHAQPRIISISQPTELGTLYTIDEITELAELAHENQMLIHVDGARLANAAVALGVSFYDMIVKSGVDLLSFGGTKNGLMAAEAVIFLNESIADDFKYIRKQGMQLCSKMRFVSAQLLAYFEDELWKRNALHANQMAQLLYDKVKDLPKLRVTQKVETNAVFVKVPADLISRLQKEFFFYVWDEHEHEVRWMTSFDTKEQDIENFVNLIKSLLA